MKKNYARQNKNGFTVIEILIVVAILGIAGVLVVSVFTQSLRGNNKTLVLSSIKKNGQNVLEMMDKNIRSADNIVCVNKDISPMSGTSIVMVKSGTYMRYRFVPPNNTNGTIGNCGSLSGSANGCIQQDNPIKQIIQGTSNLETDQQFISRVCNLNNDPLISPLTLTDTNTQTGASIVQNSGSFTRGQQAGFRDIVTISFSVGAPVNAPASIATQIDPVPFSTTIELR